MKKMVSLALDIARKAHNGQVDKAGRPYINHPVAVASMVNTDDEKTVAYLHDVVEDTVVQLDDLKAFGFGTHIVEAVDAISRRKGESRDDYLKRVRGNSLARVVKLADLKHNSDISRIPCPLEKDYQRRERYLKEIELLKK